MTNVTIVAEADLDYGYHVSIDKCGPNLPPVGVTLEDWHSLLINLRNDNPQLPYAVVSDEDSAIYQFMPEGGNMSLNVFIPVADTQMAEYLVCQAQDMLAFVANFSGKIPTFVRFSIGYAHSFWHDLEEDGELLEQDLSF